MLSFQCLQPSNALAYSRAGLAEPGLPAFLSACLSSCPPARLPTSLPACLSAWLFAFTSVHVLYSMPFIAWFEICEIQLEVPLKKMKFCAILSAILVVLVSADLKVMNATVVTPPKGSPSKPKKTPATPLGVPVLMNLICAACEKATPEGLNLGSYVQMKYRKPQVGEHVASLLGMFPLLTSLLHSIKKLSNVTWLEAKAAILSIYKRKPSWDPWIGDKAVSVEDAAEKTATRIRVMISHINRWARDAPRYRAALKKARVLESQGYGCAQQMITHLKRLVCNKTLAAYAPNNPDLLQLTPEPLGRAPKMGLRAHPSCTSSDWGLEGFEVPHEDCFVVFHIC